MRCIKINFKKPHCKKNPSVDGVTSEVQSVMDYGLQEVNRYIFI